MQKLLQTWISDSWKPLPGLGVPGFGTSLQPSQGWNPKETEISCSQVWLPQETGTFTRSHCMQLQTSYVEDVHGPSSPSQGVRIYLVAFMGISVEEADDRLVLRCSSLSRAALPSAHGDDLPDSDREAAGWARGRRPSNLSQCQHTRHI